MVFAPEAVEVVEGLAPLTPMLFAPEAPVETCRSLFGGGLLSGRYSSLGGGRPATPRFGE